MGRPAGPRGSRGVAAFLEGPVPGEPRKKVDGVPGQLHGLPCWGPWEPEGSSGPRGAPQGWGGLSPGERERAQATSSCHSSRNEGAPALTPTLPQGQQPGAVPTPL